MEPRKIIIVNESITSCNEIMSTATTVAELKAEMTREGINYDGKALVEGRSHTTFERDDQQLPTTVRFRGQETNELSIMLMTPAKKINSGSERGDIYNEIKMKGLQDCVKERCGRNFTQVPTQELKRILEESESKRDRDTQELPATSTEALPNTISEIVNLQLDRPEAERPCACTDSQAVDGRCRQALMRLLDSLEGESVIGEMEKEEILEILGGRDRYEAKPGKESEENATIDQLKDEFSWLKK